MEAVIFIGIQGSGKSTFYNVRFFDTHVRINLDMLKTKHRQQLLLNACIEGKQPLLSIIPTSWRRPVHTSSSRQKLQVFA